MIQNRITNDVKLFVINFFLCCKPWTLKDVWSHFWGNAMCTSCSENSSRVQKFGYPCLC